MTNPMLELLSRPEPDIVIMDGGMGTTAEDRGIHTQNALWGSYAFLTEEGRALNDEIHHDFIAAGAEIIIANTHNAMRPMCETLLKMPADIGPEIPGEVSAASESDRATALHRHIVQAAIESARRAVAAGRLVAVAAGVGSIEGPYAVESKVSVDEAADWAAVELAVRQEAGADCVIFETLTTREEITGVGRAIRESAGPEKSDVAVGFTCGADGRTLGGVTMAEAVRAFAGTDPLAYFVQCTRYDLVERALGELNKALDPDAVVGVYANDGRAWNNETMCWDGDRMTPETYAEHALAWRSAGARIIGGCCGTGPDHIRRLKEVLST